MARNVLDSLSCKICGHECKRPEGLSMHLKSKHNMSNLEYTTKILLNGIIPLCECGCGKEVKVHPYKVNECYRGHSGGGNWQTKYDKDSLEYKATVSKISKSVKEYMAENPPTFTEETRLKHSKYMIELMSNPEEKIRRFTKMANTKKKQSKDGTLSKNHFTKTKTKDEVEYIYNKIGSKASKTKVELFSTGDLVTWNKGLTKETSDAIEKNAAAKRGRSNEKTKNRHEESRKVRCGEYYNLIDTPEAWKIQCDCCDTGEINYIRFDTYFRAVRAQLSGKRVIKCSHCRVLGKTFSDESRLKMSVAAKNKKMDPTVVERIRNDQRIRMKQHHANMSDEDRKILGQKIKHGQWNKPQEEIDSWLKKRSDARKLEMERLGQLDKFVPSYNVATIPFIEDVLNAKYNTTFIHAKSKTGEYRIYDSECKRSYYADAYSPELNLWVEFDEHNKFDRDVLEEHHLVRENRIKELLGCEIVRIRITKDNKIIF